MHLTVAVERRGDALHGAFARDGRPLSFGEAMAALGEREPRRRLTEALAAAPFDAFVWECAPTTAALDTPFRFVALGAPSLARTRPDPKAFAAYFAAAPVATFANLGGDTTLIAPRPGSDRSVGGHLAAFVRGAPPEQVDALWAAVPPAVERWFAGGARALWLSTSGFAVPWLHLRLDPRPKYYAHQPFRAPPTASAR